MVGEGGFEPPKSLTTDLQSVPFGHSGTHPYKNGAGGRTRTPDLLITNQLLYQLSYTSVSTLVYYNTTKTFCQHFFRKILIIFSSYFFRLFRLVSTQKNPPRHFAEGENKACFSCYKGCALHKMCGESRVPYGCRALRRTRCKHA